MTQLQDAPNAETIQSFTKSDPTMGMHHQIVTLAVLGICTDCREQTVEWDETDEFFGKVNWTARCDSCGWEKTIAEIDVTLAYKDEYRWYRDEWREQYENAA